MEARAVQILSDLVAIPSTPGQHNTQWLVYASERLEEMGARVSRVAAPDGSCEGLVASIGPDASGGIVLSGHVDVVSVAGQTWTSDPFVLREAQGRLYGRGTTDMKGFVGCALAVMEALSRTTLERPVHLALSADEESSCLNALTLAQHVVDHLPPVQGVLVGEATSLRPAHLHKGSYTCVVEVQGRAAHASLPELGQSAISLAAKLAAWIEAQSGGSSDLYVTTHTVTTFQGGSANNIVPEHCRFEWDIRLAPDVSLDSVLSAARAEADRLVAPLKGAASVRISTAASFPALNMDASAPFARVCAAVAGAPCQAVSYGTEAGIFQAAGLPAIVMGPGNIAQAHIPDEFITRAQIAACVDHLTELVSR